jgi:hypothetical protein
MGMLRYQLLFSRPRRFNISLTVGRLQSLYEITRPNFSFPRARIDGSVQARLATSLKNMRIFSILTAVVLGLLFGSCSSRDQGSQLNSQAQVALSIAAEGVSSNQQQSLQQLRDLATKLEKARFCALHAETKQDNKPEEDHSRIESARSIIGAECREKYFGTKPRGRSFS